MKQMKTLTIRGTQYEIVDNATRTQLTEIVGKIAEIESGSISTEVIKQAISDYLVENPIEGLTIEEVAEYIQEHIEEFKGETGDDGASAYQIAVNNGFSGTEVEWLASLKGADGEKGNTGETGADGNGIVSVEKTSTSSLVDTYTITFSDGTSTTFNVTNGSVGTDGKSAYEIAVENGYEGTEEKWLKSLKAKSGIKKCIISIIDDGGRNIPDDNHTGLYSWLKEKGIYMTFAPSVEDFEATNSDSRYSVEQLHQMVNEGAEVIVRGTLHANNSQTCTLEEFKEFIDGSINGAKTYGFTDDVLVLPQGLQPSTSESVEEKIAYLNTLNLKGVYNVNTAAESSSIDGFEDWYTYENGGNYYGVFNKIPFVTMPYGYSKALLINRCEVKASRLNATWWVNRVKQAIEDKEYICFFMHTYDSEWTTENDDGQTTTDLFKEFITDLVDTYGEHIEWAVASDALDYINTLAYNGTSAYDIAVLNGYNGTQSEWLESLKGSNGSDGVGISDITKSGETVTITLTDNTTKTFEVENGEDLTTQGVENTNSGTVSITLSPNVFCLLSDTETGISDLTITLANGNFYDEYMCAFTTSSEGCNLTMPSTIEWLGDTPTLEASTYYELSIKNNKAVIA